MHQITEQNSKRKQMQQKSHLYCIVNHTIVEVSKQLLHILLIHKLGWCLMCMLPANTQEKVCLLIPVYPLFGCQLIKYDNCMYHSTCLDTIVKHIQDATNSCFEVILDLLDRGLCLGRNEFQHSRVVAQICNTLHSICLMVDLSDPISRQSPDVFYVFFLGVTPWLINACTCF